MCIRDRRLMVSWMAALAYSCVSVSSLMVPIFASDGGGALNLRRLQVLVFYGESPHTTVLALLPVAIVCFSRALTTREVKWKIPVSYTHLTLPTILRV